MQEIRDKGVGIQDRVLGRVGKFLAPHGWQVHREGEDPLRRRFIRERGAIRQHLHMRIRVMQGLVSVISTNPDESGASVLEPKVQFGMSLGFSSELIGDALRKFLPEDAPSFDAARSQEGLFSQDLYFALTRVFAHARPLDGEWLYETEEVDAWADRFCRWYAERAAQPLDNCRDLASLNHLVHTPWGLHCASSTWGLHEMLIALVMVHLCDDPAAPFNDWYALVCRSQIGGTDSEVARKKLILNRLVERIRAQRPAKH